MHGLVGSASIVSLLSKASDLQASDAKVGAVIPSILPLEFTERVF